MAGKPPASDAAAMRAHAAEASRLLKALSNEKRLRILCLLVEREFAVGELNEHVDLSQSALSQHLAVLRGEGLVETRREAQNILYSIANGPAKRVIETLHAIYCEPDGQSANDTPAVPPRT